MKGEMYGGFLTSKRPSHSVCMPIAKRAKIFAPFAALTGLDECIQEREIIYVERKILSSDEEERINDIIVSLIRGEYIEVEHFVQNNAESEELGQYYTTRGIFNKMSSGIIIVDNIEIQLDSISDLRIIENTQNEVM